MCGTLEQASTLLPERSAYVAHLSPTKDRLRVNCHSLTFTISANHVPVIRVEYLTSCKFTSSSISTQSDNTVHAATQFGARHVDIVVLRNDVS